MKLPNWLLTKVKFEFINRWKNWWKSGDYFVIWMGTEICRGDPYRRFINVYSVDITIINFGFTVHIEGYPLKTMEVIKENAKCNPYKIYEKNLPELRKYFRKLQNDVIKFAFGGKKPQRMIDYDNRYKQWQKKWNSIKLNPCCHCGKSADVVQDINCGTDGGPSPVIVHGLKIKCYCGMQTEIYRYRGDDEKLDAYTKCSLDWNKKK